MPIIDTVPPNDPRWPDPKVAAALLGSPGKIPAAWARISASRIQNMRKRLRDSWIGLGPLMDWLLASILARENVLLLGRPGVAKTEIAEQTFKMLGLVTPESNRQNLRQNWARTDLMQWWQEREVEERKRQKYFHYLLSRYTQPDELFGPVEIDLLRRGILARVNFGLLTGPGVRAAFLDEIFKASSSILNTLLTLLNERQHFNFGGMEPSDLLILIGASNELPGGLSSGTYGVGSSGESFSVLYAFVDRFPIRLHIPMAAGDDSKLPAQSSLAKATEMAVERETLRFTGRQAFPRTEGLPSVNDVLLLGRCLLQPDLPFFQQDQLSPFQEAFYAIGEALQPSGTSPATGEVTWTISPRKLKALYKIALAHALVTDENFRDRAEHVQSPGRMQLRVFDHIWDSPLEQGDLQSLVERHIDQFWGKRD